MKQLVQVGKGFPNRFFIAIGLLFYLSADGASAAPARKSATSDCASPSNKNKPPCAPESTTGQVTIFWPKLRMSNAVSRVLASKIEVWVDKANVGMVNGYTPLTVSLPYGPHKLELKPFDDYLENIRPVKETQITVSAQKPLYFQIVEQGLVITPSELDASTAQAVLSGKEPTPPIAVATTQPAPQVRAAGTEPKVRAGASAALAPPPGNETKVPSGSGTIYLYWRRPGLGLSFLDQYATDLPVFLDGRRIGAVKLGEYLVVKVPPGEHTIGLDVGLTMGRLLKRDFILAADSTRHFHIENQDSFRMVEDEPEEAVDYAKGLKQREVTAQ